MSETIDILKEHCLQIPVRGAFFKRALERVRDTNELDDFCRQKNINIPKLSPASSSGKTAQENLSSASTQEQAHEPEPNKTKEKRKSKDREKSSKTKQTSGGNTVVMNGCHNVVFGSVNQYYMPVMKKTNIPGQKRTSAKPKMEP